jgi:hypothetical protein
MYEALFIAVSIMILIYLKFTNFRRFLLYVAFLVGIGVNTYLADVYGTHGPISIGYYTIIPIAAVIIINVLYLALTNRKQLFIGAVVLAVVGLAYYLVSTIIVPILGTLFLLAFMGMFFNTSDGSKETETGSPDVSLSEILVFGCFA